ncbi:hypothetical protein ACFRI7_15865 [Streptomyces sp. NPDC056716]|uniref:hypothetical protein n=1 Tax=Streptomyces sp. NPDC056716 TaxID=3345922 RepID=UPI0036A7CF72
MHRHRELCEQAVDPLEIAAGLEAHGVTDRTAARFLHRDVFSLAEEMYARVPRDGEARPRAEAPAPPKVRAGWVIRTLLPGALCGATLVGLRFTEGQNRLLVAAAGVLAVGLALRAALTRGPLGIRREGSGLSGAAGIRRDRSGLSGSTGIRRDRSGLSGSTGIRRDRSGLSGAAGIRRDRSGLSGSTGIRRDRSGLSGSTGIRRDRSGLSGSTGIRRERSGPSRSTGIWTCWLLAYAVLGDGLLRAAVHGGPDTLPGGAAADSWPVATAPLLALALACAPAAWTTHLFTAVARRRLTASRGLAEFAGSVRPLLLGTFALYVGALAALAAGSVRVLDEPAALFQTLSLGALLLLARLLHLHGFTRAPSMVLTAAASAEALALATVFAARLPGCDFLSLPVDTLVDTWGPGSVPILICGTATLTLLTHASRTLTRASSHAGTEAPW